MYAVLLVLAIITLCASGPVIENYETSRDYKQYRKPDIHYDLRVADLPPLKQNDNTVLAVITSAFDIRPPILTKQLNSYLNMCELGYEVHIVLVTYASWLNNHSGIYMKMRYFCTRLLADMPIVIQKYPKSINHRLSSKHRFLFLELMQKHNYAYYINQEDDMEVRPHHLNYFAKWSQIFQGTDYYPGFAITESPITLLNVTDYYQSVPLLWMPFTGDAFPRNVHLLKYTYKATEVKDTRPFKLEEPSVDWTRNNGNSGEKIEYLLMHRKPWTPFYILNRDMLSKYSARPAWLEDIRKPWKEYNTHFHHLWLTRYFRVVTPLSDLEYSFIEHAPNRYIKEALNSTAVDKSNHNYAVTVPELMVSLYNCLGLDATKTPFLQKQMWKVATTYKTQVPREYLDKPCDFCLNVNNGEGKDKSNAAAMNLQYLQPFLESFKKLSSQAMISMQCVQEKSIVNQETAECADDVKNKDAVCEQGFGDDSRHMP